MTYLQVLRISIALGIFVGLSLPACEQRPRIGPAAQAETAPRFSEAVHGEDAGVVITARLDVLPGNSPGLERFVTPVHVVIENASNRTLSVEAARFQLIRSDASGFDPLPVDTVRGELREVTGTGASILPPSTGGFVGGRAPGRGAMDYDPFRLDPRLADMRRAELPTPEMRRTALAEGPLAPGEKRAGFLYFEPFRSETRYAAFQAALVDAATGQGFGTIRLAFARRS